MDAIVDQIEQLPIINECYQAWWELQCQTADFYSEQTRQRPPLSKQKEFRSIKNAVIQEADYIRMGMFTFEDSNAAEEIDAADISDLPYDCWELWVVTQDDTASMDERDGAATQLMELAESGSPYAQYLIGKLYQDGPLLVPDSAKAQYWFEQAAKQGHIIAQYELGNLLLSDDSEIRNPMLGLQWLEHAAHNGNDYAAYRVGKEYLRGKVIEKDSTKAMDCFTQSAEAGNQYAQYTLGKLYLEANDRKQAYYWFAQSAVQGSEYAQFFLDRWDGLKSPSVMLAVTRLLHHASRIFREQLPASSIPGGIQIDRKRLAQLRDKRWAIGHRPDDHEEQQSWGMTMG